MPDIALVSLGTTPGLVRADDAFAEIARASGVSCEILRVRIGRAGALRRHLTVTDAVEAFAARRAASGVAARVVVYSAVTAALLQKPPGAYALRFDSPAALNRPGAAGAWQRAQERKVMARASVLLPWGDAAAAAIPAEVRGVPAIPLRVPVVRGDSPPGGGRPIDALAYAGYPQKRGLDILIRGWAKGATAEARLVVAGIERERALPWLGERGIAEPANVDWRPLMSEPEWRATLASARVFVNASRREDHGLSQLEALAAGAVLVTVPSEGPYEALPLARRLDPRLVAGAIDANALAVALAAGLQADRERYAADAAPLLEPYRPESIQAVFEREVLPALGLR